MEERQSRFQIWIGRDFDHTYASDLYPKIRCFQIFVIVLNILTHICAEIKRGVTTSYQTPHGQVRSI